MYIPNSRMKAREETEAEELRRYFLHPEGFNPDRLKKNELKQSDGKVFAKIPRIPGRIVRRKKSGSAEYYIELITERVYDPAFRQTRNKKTIIGTDISWLLSGMMAVNENYYQFFDHDGNLRVPLPGLQESGKEEPQEPAEPEPVPQQETITKPDTPEGEAPMELKSEAENLREQKQELALEKARIEAERKKLEQERKELEALREEVEDERMQAIVHARERDDDHLDLINAMLDQYISAVETQAKRRSDTPMSLREIRTINDLLSEFRSFFKESEAEDYLKLAEEPDPEDADRRAGTTYGEMLLLLSAYHCTYSTFKWGHLWYKQK